MSRTALLQAVVIGLAIAGAFAPADAARVERWYSTGIYPSVQQTVTAISNRVPFALFDLLVAAAALAVLGTLWTAVRRARAARTARPLAVAVRRLVVAAAALYLVFLCLWGFNYRRVAMVDRLEVHAGAPSSGEVLQLGLDAAARLNALHAAAHGAGWDAPEWRDADLGAAFAEAQRALSDAPAARPGRLKPTILGPYFRWTGVDAMVNPFALEAVANPDLLPFERPFVAAHEWAHLAGFAHESDANFVAWLTCVRAGAPAQYSGWLFLFWQVQAEIDAGGRARIRDALDAGPLEDIAAITRRLTEGQIPALRRASWLAYDRYLRANRVQDGVRNYGAVLTLILRTQFEDHWIPVRRPIVR